MKFRQELKYVCTREQLQILESRICGIMKKDPHVSDRGSYQIRSIYFDDYYHSGYYENEDGVDNRKKYRIRIYDGSDARIRLECKHKIRGKTWKESVLLGRDLYEDIMDQSIMTKMAVWNQNFKIRENQLLQRFLTDVSYMCLTPQVIVEYKRTPYVYELGNVRVTFDRHITASNRYDLFFAGQLYGRPIMPVGVELLEVKFDEYLPDVIYQALNLNHMQLSTFSKYYLCLKYGKNPN